MSDSETSHGPRLRLPSVRYPAIISCIFLVPAGAYAFWPLGVPKHPTLPIQSAAKTTSAAPAPATLNLAAFRAPLWVAPIPPPALPAPPPPPPPLKLQLIAIARDASGPTLSASIFDPESGKILTLTQGQSIGPRTLTRITPTTIDITDTTGTRTLSLRAEAPSGGTP